MYTMNRKFKFLPILSAAVLCTAQGSLAQDAANIAAPVADPYSTLRYILISLAIVLLLVIGILGNLLITAAKINYEKQKSSGVNTAVVAAIVFFLLLSNGSYAQAETAAVVTEKSWISTTPTDILMMAFVILCELVVIFYMVRVSLGLLKKEKEKVAIAKPKISWFQKWKKPASAEEDQKLDLHHDYDGIRELDNNIPGWWKMGFYASIAFGVLYLFRMFVSESMPLQAQELARANEIAEIKKAAFLKSEANNVDENTVTMLDAGGIALGYDLYVKNCVACHGDKGQGGVGPNLTDEYWIHKGGIKDIFKTIKYGVAEKGMKAWKEDFSPVQIAQISSYIRSIKNTHAAGGKEKQGEVYVEEAGAAAPVADSVNKK